MSVFISHTRQNQEDRDHLDNVRQFLDDDGMPLWLDHQNLVGGSDLREQIIRAVRECEVCVFIATPRSIQSDWCLIEIGAFLGIGKPVIAFRAGVSQDDLPDPLRSDLATGSLATLASSVRSHLEAARSQEDRRTLADLTVSTFQSMLLQSAGLNEVVLGQSVVGVLLGARAVAGIGGDAITPSPARAFSGGQIGNLLRLPRRVVEPHAREMFDLGFVLEGAQVGGIVERWEGFAVSADDQGVYQVLLLGFSHKMVVSVAVVTQLRPRGDQWEVVSILDAGERRPEGLYRLTWRDGREDD